MIKDLADFKVYGLAMDFGEEVSMIVSTWDYFHRDTIGKQFVRSADSIAANLAEGLGRYHFKDAKNFGYFSRGSLYESRTWLTKAFSRKLISDSSFKKLLSDLETIGKMLNSYIKSIGHVNEPIESYGDELFNEPSA